MPSRGDQRAKEEGPLRLGCLTTADFTKRMTPGASFKLTNRMHMEQLHKQRSLQEATVPASRSETEPTQSSNGTSGSHTTCKIEKLENRFKKSKT